MNSISTSTNKFAQLADSKQKSIIDASIYEFSNNGFKNASDYWQKASCKQFIPSIKTTSLLINALDDPFLTTDSFPVKEAFLPAG